MTCSNWRRILQNFRKAVFRAVTHGLFTFSFLSPLAVHELHSPRSGSKRSILYLPDRGSPSNIKPAIEIGIDGKKWKWLKLVSDYSGRIRLSRLHMPVKNISTTFHVSNFIRSDEAFYEINLRSYKPVCHGSVDWLKKIKIIDNKKQNSHYS